MKALTKDRDQRYASALEFAREFARAVSVPGAVEALPTTKVVEPDIARRAQEDHAEGAGARLGAAQSGHAATSQAERGS
jgi:hypothetical protein